MKDTAGSSLQPEFFVAICPVICQERVLAEASGILLACGTMRATAFALPHTHLLLQEGDGFVEAAQSSAKTGLEPLSHLPVFKGQD